MRQRYLYLYSGAIGDALVAIQLGRVLAANVPQARLELVSTRRNDFVRELVVDLPFVRYRELEKTRLLSWLVLPGFAVRRYNSALHEPVTSNIPLWWKLILWCSRQCDGTEVRVQRVGNDRPVPQNVRKVSYNCNTESFFIDAPVTILGAWGISADERPLPSLPHKMSQVDRPYLLFHFFAANYRRSIPVDHARSILQEARSRFPQHRFIVTCGAGERGMAERMCEGIVDLTLESDLHASDMVSLLSGADLVTGTASGILFVAVHLSVPVVALSCLVDPCFLPTYSATTTILAARDECRCNGDKTGDCSVDTPEGKVFRCLFFISTASVISAMIERLSV